MEWISQNSDVLQVVLTALSAVVWLAYLQLLYLGYVRQRQAVIMIHHGAAEDDRARLIVSNMGAEPIYIIAILARLTVDGEIFNASVIDREELSFEHLDTPLKRTNQGPLKSGEYLDAGSFGDLIWRARQRLGLSDDTTADDIEITVGAASGHASKLVVAKRKFSRQRGQDGTITYVPTTILTRQVRSNWNRRKALRELNYVSED
ncbi:hypothetical protein ABMC89_12415 [Sulfitobacter sp. HNIBRBA3233]|uniref:hypothetical protein n=1 Tax=Sulfitobacter marinivivus TaxID=3158558 RepID=UPI0032DFA80F